MRRLLVSPDIRAGLRDIAPVMIACLPIGALFGAVAAGKGLSVLEVALMSLLVFAGGAQFAAVELWVYPVPIWTLAFSTALINARHVLMSASLAPKLARFPGRARLLGMFFLTDEAWALAEKRALSTPLTPTYWFAMAATLPVAWVGSSALGAVAGALLGDPARYGADFAFTALFIGLVAGFNKGRITAVTVAASGACAALVHVTVGSPWHVLAGAFAGILAAALFARPQDMAPQDPSPIRAPRAPAREDA
ncbi:MAG TPA: AzlC family ABC transporter permease [Beijerinckiaceae bacterium]|nr:AzlC family ABC transporter permease [Beijerinckiaceae bacterium]